MRLGLGLYRHQLDAEHYAFARQCGVTDLVVHLVDYFNKGQANPAGNQPTGDSSGWGVAGDGRSLWSVDALTALRLDIEKSGLRLAAVENIDPAHWHDVLLDGPLRDQHIENVRTIIRRLGEARIPVLGYNFSIAGVASRVTGPFARGGALSVGMEGVDETPIPNGMAWNMVYDPEADPGCLPRISHDELWDRFSRFLRDVVPVAEQAGVVLALHPDDPPAPFVRQQPRLVFQPSMYRRMLGICSEPANQIELCVGTLAEMTDGGVYEAIDEYAKAGRVAYVHLRNVRGRVPHYQEAFIDDGDVEAPRVLRILRDAGFNGVIVPDHTPQMSCSAPWHAGMAHAVGYMSGVLAEMRRD